MNPIKNYLKSIFAQQRVIGNDPTLKGLVKADTVLNNLINEKRVPGFSITVLKEGKTLLQKGYGYADLERKIPVDAAKTIFRIASVSKPIAATALACMVFDGSIDLDISFYEYVPYYPKKKWDFTIRQLASHTAGIRGYKGVEYGLNRPYTIKESIAIFKDDDLIFEPGRGYFYNSFDWVLVSLAMQEASGIPFEEYVRQKVLHPLELENTFAECHPNSTRGFGEAPRDEESTAFFSGQNRQDQTKFYSKNRLGFRTAIPVNNFYKLAGGGYLSTSADIAKLGQAYLDGTILPEDIRSQFLTSQTVKGKPIYYGLGWQVSADTKGRPYYGHVGSGVGGYSNFFVYPEERMVFAILVNCTDPKVQGELDDVVDALLTTTKLQTDRINS
ncbi:CubicO group peptidase, beta-lactamase class C family [Pricia antarctica]|uniref:CubicO group peptidase, beta-lactamase class C family n=1 Tax=Pricia antarctica TaxID=641691 RepID=A0A1G7GQI6_9FLAO|nr:serine hydrolase domain-containing protein [Pricia antarctica]SDE90397.1 CubicO group peptidase, beta-lactamase class C family [Pricia antarctica]